MQAGTPDRLAAREGHLAASGSITRSAGCGSHSASYVGCIASAQETVGKGANMKVSAYYSINPSDPDVYHDHDDCPEGQQIPARNKSAGTNHYRRCLSCTKMG